MSRTSPWCNRHLSVCSYYIGLCLSEKAFRRELKKLKVPANKYPDFMGSCHADATTHYFERKDKYCALVCFPKNSKRTAIEICGLLVHEAVHIWQAHCDAIGEKYPSSEFEAYAIQSIAQELMTKYSELGGPS